MINGEIQGVSALSHDFLVTSLFHKAYLGSPYSMLRKGILGVWNSTRVILHFGIYNINAHWDVCIRQATVGKKIWPGASCTNMPRLLL